MTVFCVGTDAFFIILSVYADSPQTDLRVAKLLSGHRTVCGLGAELSRGDMAGSPPPPHLDVCQGGLGSQCQDLTVAGAGRGR